MNRLRRGIALGLILGMSGCAGFGPRSNYGPTIARKSGPTPLPDASATAGDPFQAPKSQGFLSRYFPGLPMPGKLAADPVSAPTMVSGGEPLDAPPVVRPPTMKVASDEDGPVRMSRRKPKGPSSFDAAPLLPVALTARPHPDIPPEPAERRVSARVGAKVGRLEQGQAAPRVEPRTAAVRKPVPQNTEASPRDDDARKVLAEADTEPPAATPTDHPDGIEAGLPIGPAVTADAPGRPAGPDEAKGPVSESEPPRVASSMPPMPSLQPEHDALATLIAQNERAGRMDEPGPPSLVDVSPSDDTAAEALAQDESSGEPSEAPVPVPVAEPVRPREGDPDIAGRPDLAGRPRLPLRRSHERPAPDPDQEAADRAPAPVNPSRADRLPSPGDPNSKPSRRPGYRPEGLPPVRYPPTYYERSADLPPAPRTAPAAPPARRESLTARFQRRLRGLIRPGAPQPREERLGRAEGPSPGPPDRDEVVKTALRDDPRPGERTEPASLPRGLEPERTVDPIPDPNAETRLTIWGLR